MRRLLLLILVFFSLNAFANGNQQAWDMLNRQKNPYEAFKLFKKSYKQGNVYDHNSVEGLIWSLISLGKTSMAGVLANYLKVKKGPEYLPEYLKIIQFIYEKRFETIEVADEILRKKDSTLQEFALLAKTRGLIFTGNFIDAKETLSLLHSSTSKEYISLMLIVESSLDFENAKIFFEKHADSIAVSDTAYFELAKAYLSHDHVEKADQMLTTILEDNKSNPEAWGLRSLAMWNANRPKLARSYSKKAIKLNKDSYFGQMSQEVTNPYRFSLSYDSDTETYNTATTNSKIVRTAPTLDVDWNYSKRFNTNFTFQKIDYDLNRIVLNTNFAYLYGSYTHSKLLIQSHLGSRFGGNVDNQWSSNFRASYQLMDRLSITVGNERHLISEKLVDKNYDVYRLSFGSNGISEKALREGYVFNRNFLSLWSDLKYFGLYTEYGVGSTSDSIRRNTFDISFSVPVSDFFTFWSPLTAKLILGYFSFGFDRKSLDYFSPTHFSGINSVLNLNWKISPIFTFDLKTGLGVVKDENTGWSYEGELKTKFKNNNYINLKHSNFDNQVYHLSKYSLNYAREF